MPAFAAVEVAHDGKRRCVEDAVVVMEIEKEAMIAVALSPQLFPCGIDREA